MSRAGYEATGVATGVEGDARAGMATIEPQK